MKKNYAYYNNPKINSFKDLMNLSIKKPDDIAFKYLDNSKVLISKTYKDFYDDVRLTSNYIANLYNNNHIALILFVAADYKKSSGVFPAVSHKFRDTAGTTEFINVFSSNAYEWTNTTINIENSSSVSYKFSANREYELITMV